MTGSSLTICFVGDDTVPGLGAEEPTSIHEPTAASLELAWSSEDVEAPEKSPWAPVWGTAAGIVFCAAVTALVIGIVGWVSRRESTDKSSLPASTTTIQAEMLPPVSTTPIPAGPSLDGSYELRFDIGAATYRGTAEPPKRSGAITIWWAFQSSCTPAGCTAVGVKLDDTDHSVRSPKNITDTLTFISGRWEDGSTPIPARIPGCDTASIQWAMQPLPDGTLAGIETVTVDSGCPSQGNSTVTPFTVTRIGPVAAGVLPIN